jgi:hypothetical protein
MQLCITQLRAGAAWVWSHRTKAIGGVGMAAAYCFENQEKLGLFIPAASMAHTMLGIGIVTFVVGLYNTFFQPKEP